MFFMFEFVVYNKFKLYKKRFLNLIFHHDSISITNHICIMNILISKALKYIWKILYWLYAITIHYNESYVNSESRLLLFVVFVGMYLPLIKKKVFKFLFLFVIVKLPVIYNINTNM